LAALARRAWLQAARAPRPLLLSAALERPG
jgi:hypothetical protein